MMPGVPFLSGMLSAVLGRNSLGSLTRARYIAPMLITPSFGIQRRHSASQYGQQPSPARTAGKAISKTTHAERLPKRRRARAAAPVADHVPDTQPSQPRATPLRRSTTRATPRRQTAASLALDEKAWHPTEREAEDKLSVNAAEPAVPPPEGCLFTMRVDVEVPYLRAALSRKQHNASSAAVPRTAALVHSYSHRSTPESCAGPPTSAPTARPSYAHGSSVRRVSW